MKNARGSLILLFVACLWGSTITIQGMAGGTVDVFTFQMLRGLLGASGKSREKVERRYGVLRQSSDGRHGR